MLMTPITPKVMASPIAASSSTEPSDSPYQAFCTVAQIASSFWIEVDARLARRAGPAAGASAGRPASRFSASWSPRARITPTASSLSTSEASSEYRMTAARASVSACLIARVGFLRQAPRRAPAARSASRDLNTACAASKRWSGSRACKLRPPSAASSARRTRLLRRTSLRSAGSAPAPARRSRRRSACRTRPCRRPSSARR